MQLQICTFFFCKKEERKHKKLGEREKKLDPIKRRRGMAKKWAEWKKK